VSYSVSVDPEVAVNYTGRDRVQLTVSYDTKYNVSIVASLCGETTTYFVMINNHGKLGTPKSRKILTSILTCSDMPFNGFT
jgi:hypothetical protein